MEVKANFLLILSAVLTAGVSAGGPSQCGRPSEIFRGIYELVANQSTFDFNATQAYFNNFKYLCSSSVFSTEIAGYFHSEFVYLSLSTLTNIEVNIIKSAVESGKTSIPLLDCILSELIDLIAKIRTDAENLKSFISANCIPSTLDPNSTCFEVNSRINTLISNSFKEISSESAAIIDFYAKAKALGVGPITLEAIQWRAGQFPVQFTTAIGALGNADPVAVFDFVEGRSASLPAPLICSEAAIAGLYSYIKQAVDNIFAQIAAV